VLLQPRGARKDALGTLIERVFGPFFGWFNRALQARQRALFRAHRRHHRAGAAADRGVRFPDRPDRLAFTLVPSGFIPTQDKQYLFAALQLPEGATLKRTEAAMRRMGEMALATPGVETWCSSRASTRALRQHQQCRADVRRAHAAARARHQRGRDRQACSTAIQRRSRKAWPSPCCRRRCWAWAIRRAWKPMCRIARGRLRRTQQPGAGAVRGAARHARLRSVTLFSSFQANVPQLDASVDRIKAKEQGLALTEIYRRLQVYLGSAYVNDFNLFGRTYSVYAQADATSATRSSDISRIKVRNAAGQMVPIGSLVE
jgi:multidrug efflux pump subunit AcrB